MYIFNHKISTNVSAGPAMGDGAIRGSFTSVMGNNGQLRIWGGTAICVKTFDDVNVVLVV